MLRVPFQARPVVRRQRHRVLVVLTLVVAQFCFWLGQVAPTSAASASQTVDLRVLVIDDDQPWVDAMASQMTVEGVPFTSISMASASRPTINAAFLASGDHAFYQAVVMSSYEGGGLSAAELTALRAFEATFGVREVDGYNWANPAVGLNYAGRFGDIAGTVATVTAAGFNSGFQYLNGPVPWAVGSYSWIAEPLSATSTPPMPAGASFTTLVSAPLPNTTTPGSLVGVYSSGGVEQLIITSAMNFYQPHFKLLAHGIITWATHGVHLGYNRNNMTFHVDDAWSDVALWDSEHNCTPGEDCPVGSGYPENTIRLTPDDVTYAVQWQAAHDYTFTLAYNGFTAAAGDPLTDSLVANKGSFKWLNHGLEHIYQGCVQNFTVTPWACTTDGGGNIQWVTQAQIYSEISQNLAVATTYGLPIDPTEYLSGEHSGLFFLPQQPADNPNFALALTQAGIKTIGADASREPGARPVGSAITVPRHPTILYYNASTAAAEVDEYNWFYTSRADGGSGYCDDNPTVATCGPPLAADGFLSTMVPNDAAFDLSFILSNDPRPFYAHTSNMGADRVIYPLVETILNTYRAGFNPNAPLLNMTMTEISKALTQQSAWAASGMTATPAAKASIKNGVVTITNTGTGPVPMTAPIGTTVSGVVLEPYGGELSGWLPGAPTTTVTLAGVPVITLGGSPDFVVGTPGSFTISATGTPTPTIAVTGALPAGLTFANGAAGSASISGTATGAGGNYPISITASNSVGTTTVAATLRVGVKPVFTSAASRSQQAGTAFTFAVTTTGSPAATLTSSGTLPSGVTFTPNATGGATLGGTPALTSAGTYPLTFTATNWAGTTTQSFVLTITGALPAFTSAAATAVTIGNPFTFQVTTTGTPAPTITRTGTLPAGVTFTNNGNGTATLAGTPTTAGTFPQTLRATNALGFVQQSFVLTVSQGLGITSAASAAFNVGTNSTFTVRATGAPVPALSVSGALPSGVTFVNNGNGTATLAGRPAAGTAGTYPLTITATNTSGSVTQAFTLTIRQAPAFTSPANLAGRRSRAISFAITTTGSPAATISKIGGLPSGLVWTANSNGTASITGTTTAAGTWLVLLTAQNPAGVAIQLLVIRIT